MKHNKELETLKRLKKAVDEAIVLIECDCVVEDADVLMPPPFHFRLGDFSIHDATQERWIDSDLP